MLLAPRLVASPLELGETLLLADDLVENRVSWADLHHASPVGPSRTSSLSSRRYSTTSRSAMGSTGPLLGEPGWVTARRSTTRSIRHLRRSTQ